jgi:chromosome segregation ATPase
VVRGCGLGGVWTSQRDSRRICAVARDPEAGGDLQARIDALVRQLAAHRADLDSLEARAEAANHRADEADRRVDTLEARADHAELAALVDRDMLSELQREGVLNRAHRAQMEQALATSRIIGAAIGMLMERERVSYDQAFAAFVDASARSGHKLYDLATELVAAAGATGPRQ